MKQTVHVRKRWQARLCSRRIVISGTKLRISERNAKKKQKFLLSLPHSRENGYVAEVVAEGARYDYLVRLTKK